MKKILITLLLFVGCATQVKVFDVAPSFNNPSKYKLAVLPIIITNNPTIESDEYLTMKFEKGFKDLGFRIIDSFVLNSVIQELNIELDGLPTMKQLKAIREKVDCDAFAVITLDYYYMSKKSSASITEDNASFDSRDGYYRTSNETLKILDSEKFETLASISVHRGSNSMSDEIFKELKNHFKN